MHVLDSVRGVAAFIVVIHHCLLTQPGFSDYFFSNWKTDAGTTAQQLMFDTPLRILWGGSEAVILFYVLSGLVLALPWVAGKPPSYRSYAIRRICRIYLPYCVAIAGAAVLALLLYPYAHVTGLSDWLNEMTWTVPVTGLAMLDHAVMLGHHNTINGVIHTLIWEMRVSLVFPLFIVPIVRWRVAGALFVLLVLIGLIGAAQLVYGGGDPALQLLRPTAGGGVLRKLVLEAQWTAYYACFFVFGSVIALYLDRLRRGLSVSASVLLLVAGLLIFQGHWTFSMAAQEFMVALGACLIIVSTLPQGPVHALLSHRWLQWVGRISYSLYLVHVPLLLTAVLVLHDVLPVWAILLAVAPASLLLGWVFHEVVAEPCVRLGRRLSRRGLAEPAVDRGMRVSGKA